MKNAYNGISATSLGADGWEKPWSGTNGGNCVEAKRLPDGMIALRQSTDPSGAALIYTRDELAAFIAGAKAGQADYLLEVRTRPEPHRPYMDPRP